MSLPADALDWRKASRSTDGGSACVETAWTGNTVGYRDSKHVNGPKLWFPATASRLLVSQLQAGGLAGAE